MRLLVVLLMVYAGFALFALLVAERAIFQPPPPSYGAGSFPYARIPVGAGDSLAVLHLRHPRAAYTILYSHGNAEDLGYALPLLSALRDLGFDVVAYDYRGYGQSTGGPATTRKAVEDAEAAYAYAVGALGVPPDRLLAYGSSVGTGLALHLAARHELAGLILQSAFISTFRVITRWRLLPFDRFPNLTHIREVRCPILFIHGMRDRVIPAWHGRRLFAEAAAPKQALWVEAAGHNDLWPVAGPRLQDAFGRFISLVDGSATPE